MAQNPLFGAQPFEELAATSDIGQTNEPEPTSPTSLEDFYREQEKKDLERRLSKSKSLRRRRGRSKSVASSSEGPHSPDQELRGPRSPVGVPEETTDKHLGTLQEAPTSSNNATPPQPQELAWHRERAMTGTWFTPDHVFKTHYEIHNNVPPLVPWTNHHLRPPGTPWPPPVQKRKVSMPTPPNPQLLQNIPPVTQARDLQGANSVNSSSGSNNSLPKNPAIGPPVVYATDHIDMLDPSDPWGMRWHHDGRYEVGVTPTPRGNPTATWAGTSSPAVDVPSRPRTRGNTPAGPNGSHRSGPKSPSPLSQSTSAVQLKNGSSISLDTPKQLHRRLSKRNSANPTPHTISSLTSPLESNNRTGTTKRTSGLRALFSRDTGPPQPNYPFAPQMQLDRRRSKTLGSTSEPPTSFNSVEPSPSTPNPLPNAEPLTISSMPNESNLSSRPPSNTLATPQPSSTRPSLTPSPTKDKRSSYLGRLVKKFSIIRHNTEPEPKSKEPAILQRSASNANGIYPPRKDERDPVSHPKFASAPAESMLSAVPELRLVQSPEQDHDPHESEPTNLNPVDPAIDPSEENASSPIRSSPPSPSGNHRTTSSPPSGSPQPQLARFGGLVVANPDTPRDSEAESLATGSPRRNDTPLLRKSRPSPQYPDLDSQPQPSLLRALDTPSLHSATSTNFTPLRVVNGGEPETASETGTIGGDIKSPISTASTIPPPVPSPSDKFRSLPGASTTNLNSRSIVDLALLSPIPSIPDIPPTPDAGMRSIGNPQSDDDMRTALENLSPLGSALSLSAKPSNSPTITMITEGKPSSATLTPLNTAMPARESPRPQESSGPPQLPSLQTFSEAPMSLTETMTSPKMSPSPKEVPERPKSTVSTATFMTVSSESTVPVPSPVPSPPPVRSPARLLASRTTSGGSPRSRAEPSSVSGSEDFARPQPRTSSLATPTTARYGAYYSPSLYPALTVTPQLDPNPLPTPPQRLPPPSPLSESGSHERLVGSSSKERLEERVVEKRKSTGKDEHRRPSISVGSRSSKDFASPSSASTTMSPSSYDLASPPPHALGSPNSDPKSSGDGRLRGKEPIKEKRNNSTFHLFTESRSSPNSRDQDSDGSKGSRSRELPNRKAIASHSREFVSDDPKRVSVGSSKKDYLTDFSSSNVNQSRAPIEKNTGYNVLSSRPTAIHANLYHASNVPGERVGRSAETGTDSTRRRRALSSAASSDTNTVSVKEEARKRANSIKGDTSTSSSIPNGVTSTAKPSSSRRPSAYDSREREDSRREHDREREEAKKREKQLDDAAKQVISGFGQNWEVIEAVMISPNRPSSKLPNSHGRELSNGGSREGNGSAGRSSSGADAGSSAFPTRSSSRPGYTVAGEPIGLSSSPPSSASGFPPALQSKRGSSGALRDQMPAALSKDTDRPKPQHERDHGSNRKITENRSSSQTDPARRIRSKSRSKTTPLPPGVDLNKPQPPRPPPTPSTTQQELPTARPIANGVPTPFHLAAAAGAVPSLKRDSGTSKKESVQRARPTSEVVNVPELGAQEVWEHDRMTARGQSVMLPDGFAVGPSSSQRTSAGSSLSQQPSQYSNSHYAPGAGSAHTRIVVQPPFQPQGRSSQNSGYYYSQQGSVPNPLPAPPTSVIPPKSSRNRF